MELTRKGEIMNTKTDDLLTIIESLPIDIKTELVEKILASMHPIKKEMDEEWKKTAEVRVAEIRAGNVKLIPGDEVFDEIWEKYGR